MRISLDICVDLVTRAVESAAAQHETFLVATHSKELRESLFVRLDEEVTVIAEMIYISSVVIVIESDIIIILEGSPIFMCTS